MPFAFFLYVIIVDAYFLYFFLFITLFHVYSISRAGGTSTLVFFLKFLFYVLQSFGTLVIYVSLHEPHTKVELWGAAN